MEEPPEENPISFAQIQAEQIRADARREADELLAQAREAADRERAAVFAQARDEGHAEGYAAGMAQAAEQARITPGCAIPLWGT